MAHKPERGKPEGTVVATAMRFDTFQAGERVPRTGDYACKTCASKRDSQHIFTMHFTMDEYFPACPGCGEGSFWEPAHPRRE